MTRAHDPTTTQDTPAAPGGGGCGINALRLVAKAGADTIKRMNLELGGKTPMIVFDDADLGPVLCNLSCGHGPSVVT